MLHKQHGQSVRPKYPGDKPELARPPTHEWENALWQGVRRAATTGVMELLRGLRRGAQRSQRAFSPACTYRANTWLPI